MDLIILFFWASSGTDLGPKLNSKIVPKLDKKVIQDWNCIWITETGVGKYNVRSETSAQA